MKLKKGLEGCQAVSIVPIPFDPIQLDPDWNMKCNPNASDQRASAQQRFEAHLPMQTYYSVSALTVVVDEELEWMVVSL